MSKKQAGIVLLAVLLLFSLPGCVMVNFGSDAVVGKGDMVKRSYDVGSFESVNLQMVASAQGWFSQKDNGIFGFEVIYRNGQECRVELEMPDDLFDYVTVSVNNGQLLIDSSKNIIANTKESLKLYVTAPALSALTLAGGVSVKDADKITGESLNVTVSGACDMDLDLDVQSLVVDLSGAGELVLKGKAEKAEIELSGAGQINALGLETADAVVSMSGAGDCAISCSQTLQAELSGVGSLRYRGEAHVTQDVSGLGVIKKID